MNSYRIPHEQWSQFFDDFSRQHQNWRATVEVNAPDLGSQTALRDMPLQGISYDTRGTGADMIEISTGERPDAHLAHVIDKPIQVEVAEGQASEVAIQIQSVDGPTTLLRVAPDQSLPA